jgi:hypothetical protein
MFSTSKDRLFSVHGNKLLEIDTIYNIIERGTIESITGVVCFAENSVDQMMIVDGNNGYIYSLNDNTLEEITADGFVAGTSVICIDGFFVCNKTGTGQFALSDYQKGKIWNGSNFYEAESLGDPIQALAKLNNEIWVIGLKSIEAWYNNGGNTADPADVFTRTNQATMDMGTSAPNSVQTNGNALFWLGRNSQGAYSVWMATGYQPQRISTHAIEYRISKLADSDEVRAYCYQKEGHFFYVLNFINSDMTIVYDLTTGLWHDWLHFNELDGTYSAHYAVAHAFFNGKNIVGNRIDGKIYELDLDYYKDGNSTIRRERTGGHISEPDRKRMFFKSFELDLLRGQGLQSGQGVDPQVMLTWSDDGGETWSDERTATAGKVGKYKTCVDWNRLGSARDRVFKIAVSDPVKWVLSGAIIEATAGNG